MAEIILEEFGVTIEAEAFHDQPVEETHEVVCEEEGADLLLHHRIEALDPGIEGVAMGAVDALDAFLGEHAVELSARAAIAVEAHDSPIALAVRPDLAAHGFRDALRPVVQDGRQTGHR